jgi:16S rRNA (guanine1207-N2)-methyltransferase
VSSERSEKFALKTIPAYFFKNQEMDSLLVPQVGPAFKHKLKAILPRLKFGGKAKAGLYFQDRYRAKAVNHKAIIDLALALEKQAVLFIVSHRDWGEKSLGKFLRTVFGEANVEVLERGMAGFRLIGVRIPDRFNPETENLELEINLEVTTPTGLKIKKKLKSEQSLFSAQKLDMGTKLILETVDFTQYSKILDFGCGWGALGTVALLSNPEAEVVLVDNDPRAVAVASQNLVDLGLESRGKVLISDTPGTVEGKFDLVVSHPPYHLSNETLVKIFTDAKDKLTQKGQIIIGTDLTYLGKFTQILTSLKFEVTTMKELSKYFVLSAS